MSDPMFQRIVVGVDRREGGRDALALAALLQRTCGGELVAVYAYPYDRTVSLDRAAGVEAVLQEDLLVKLEGELARAGVTARTVVVSDASPARALHAIAMRDDADLIVVGAPHRSGADRVLGGDVAAGTLHGAPCAVAVAPSGYADREVVLRTIGAGFDDTTESRRTLVLARRIAHAAKGSLRAYTVVAPTAPMWPGTADDLEWPDFETAARERGRAKLRAALAEIGDDGDGAAIVGDPARELARRSGHVDLLVVARARTAHCAGCSSAAPRANSCERPSAPCSSCRAASRRRAGARTPSAPRLPNLDPERGNRHRRHRRRDRHQPTLGPGLRLRRRRAQRATTTTRV